MTELKFNDEELASIRGMWLDYESLRQVCPQPRSDVYRARAALLARIYLVATGIQLMPSDPGVLDAILDPARSKS